MTGFDTESIAINGVSRAGPKRSTCQLTVITGGDQSLIGNVLPQARTRIA